MWPAAVLVGRTLADLLTATLCTAIVVAVGLVIGWTPGGSVLDTLGGLAVFLLFSYALSWMCAASCLETPSRPRGSA
jgi:ABC-2 type transport system permease protein